MLYWITSESANLKPNADNGSFGNIGGCDYLIKRISEDGDEEKDGI